MGDVWVMVEPRRVVIDVGYRHGHGGRAGQAFRLPSICRYHQQLVIDPVLAIQQGTGNNLSCRWVDGELAMSSAQAVAV